MSTVLVAVSGITPAILTETLWALALEEEPLIPAEVVVITTQRGREDICAQLLTPRPDWSGRTVWDCLRETLLQRSGYSTPSFLLQLVIRVIELPDPVTGIKRPALDVRNRVDNDSVADTIISVLAPLCDAADRRVVASIAGGRKTMGALLYAAMSLLGKEGDRVTHVLVPEEYERTRDFFYPEQPVQTLEWRDLEGVVRTVQARDACIELADIPFVPLRNKFEELNEPRRTFSGLVECYSRAERRELGALPRVRMDVASGVIRVEGREIPLAGRELVVCAFLHDRALEGKAHFRHRGEAAQALAEYQVSWQFRHPGHPATNRLSGPLSDEDLSKALTGLRNKLQRFGLEGAIPYLAPRRGRIGFEFRSAQ